jgi:hypothetical protein
VGRTLSATRRGERPRKDVRGAAGTRSALPFDMTSRNQFEFAHDRHPLLTAATDLYRSLQAIECPSRAAAKLRKIDRVATQLFVDLARAIDFPSPRARRVASALDCIVTLDALLSVLLLDAVIEPDEHARLWAELRALARAVEALSRPASRAASQNRAAEPESVAPIRTGLPPEADAARDSAGPLAHSDPSSQSPGSPHHAANDSVAATAAPEQDPDLPSHDPEVELDADRLKKAV